MQLLLYFIASKIHTHTPAPHLMSLKSSASHYQCTSEFVARGGFALLVMHKIMCILQWRSLLDAVRPGVDMHSFCLPGVLH